MKNKIYNLVSTYLAGPKNLTHRKMAALLKMKDWEAYECSKVQEDLKTNIDIGSFKNFSSTSNIMKEFGLHRYTIEYLLYKNNISVGYSYDEDFFSTDTPASFYWAGFIAADGCISKNSNTLDIGLAAKDYSHLEKFKIAIKSNNPIFNYETKNGDQTYYGSKIRITCAKIKSDLKRFNIIPRKTDRYIMPDWLVSHNLINHFLRGYFDGDGSCFITKKQNMAFSLCGTYIFLEQCQEILKSVVNPNKIQFKSGKLYEIQHRGNKCTKPIFNFLYNNSNDLIMLDRKFKLAEA